MHGKNQFRQRSDRLGWLLIAAGTVLAWGWLQGVGADLTTQLSVARGSTLLYGDSILSGAMGAASVAALAVGACLVGVLRSRDANEVPEAAMVTSEPPTPFTQAELGTIESGMRIDAAALSGFEIGGQTGEVSSYVRNDSDVTESPWTALTAGSQRVRLDEAQTTNLPRFIVHQGKLIPLHARNTESDIIARIGGEDCEPIAA